MATLTLTVNGVSNDTAADNFAREYIDWVNLTNIEDGDSTSSATCTLVNDGTLPAQNPQDIFFDSFATYTDPGRIAINSCTCRVWTYKSNASELVEMAIEAEETTAYQSLTTTLAYYDYDLNINYITQLLDYCIDFDLGNDYNCVIYVNKIQFIIDYSYTFYGLETFDENGDKTLSVYDRLTRLLYTTEVAAGASGSYTLTDALIPFKEYYGNSTIFSDDFNDNSLNSSIWTAVEGGGKTVEEQNQQLELVADSTNTGNIVTAYQTVTGDFEATVKFVGWDSTSATATMGFALSLSGYSIWYMDAYLRNGNLNFGVDDTVTDDSSSITAPSFPFWIKFKRIRSTATIYSSTNGTTWTQQLTGDTDDGELRLCLYQYPDTNVASTSKFDDFDNLEDFYNVDIGTMYGFAYTLEEDKLPHTVTVEESGDDIVVSWSPVTMNCSNGPTVASSKSLIVAVLY